MATMESKWIFFSQLVWSRVCTRSSRTGLVFVALDVCTLPCWDFTRYETLKWGRARIWASAHHLWLLWNWLSLAQKGGTVLIKGIWDNPKNEWETRADSLQSGLQKSSWYCGKCGHKTNVPPCLASLFFVVVVKEIYLSIYLFYVFECFVYTHHFHACCPGVLDEGIRFPRKGVTDGVDSGVQAL